MIKWEKDIVTSGNLSHIQLSKSCQIQEAQQVDLRTVIPSLYHLQGGPIQMP